MLVLLPQSAVKMKILCQKVVNKLLGDELDYAKVLKLTQDSGLDTSDVKAVVAALNYILLNAAKYNVDERTLANELQQLGACLAERDEAREGQGGKSGTKGENGGTGGGVE